MASEVTLTVSLHAIIGGVHVGKTYSKVIDVSGDGVIHNIQSITTDGEVLERPVNLGSGYPIIFIKNLDPTNYVTLGVPDDSNNQLRLYPGESCVFRSQYITTLFAKANTNTCKIEYIMLEE